MNLKLLKGYVLATIAILVLGGAVVLLVMNFGDKWTLHVYWKERTLPRAVWLLLAGAGGLLVYWTLRKLLPRAVANLREGRQIRRSQQTDKSAENLEKNQQK